MRTAFAVLLCMLCSAVINAQEFPRAASVRLGFMVRGQWQGEKMVTLGRK
jgi:hypothetical protein